MLRQTPIGLDLTRYSLQPLLGSMENGWELVSPLANFKVCSDTESQNHRIQNCRGVDQFFLLITREEHGSLPGWY